MLVDLEATRATMHPILPSLGGTARRDSLHNMAWLRGVAVATIVTCATACSSISRLPGPRCIRSYHRSGVRRAVIACTTWLGFVGLLSRPSSRARPHARRSRGYPGHDASDPTIARGYGAP